jgi:hypothetical protein
VNRESVSVKTKQAEVDQFQDKKHKQSKQKQNQVKDEASRKRSIISGQRKQQTVRIKRGKRRLVNFALDHPTSRQKEEPGEAIRARSAILKSGIQFIAVVVSPVLQCQKRSQN